MVTTNKCCLQTSTFKLLTWFCISEVRAEISTIDRRLGVSSLAEEKSKLRQSVTVGKHSIGSSRSLKANFLAAKKVAWTCSKVGESYPRSFTALYSRTAGLGISVLAQARSKCSRLRDFHVIIDDVLKYCNLIVGTIFHFG